MKKPTLILVTKNLPPDKGGMERMWHEATRELAGFCDLHVIGPAAAAQYMSNRCIYHKVPKYLPFFFITSLVKATIICLRYKAIAIVSGSGVTLFPVMLSGYLTNTKTACYLHGLDIIYPSHLYQLVFKHCIRRMHCVFVNSHNTKRLAIEAKVASKKISVIMPGINKPEKPGTIDNQYYLEHSVQHLIFFGRITARKGLTQFIEKCFMSLLENASNIHLHIVGLPPPDKKNNPKSEYARLLRLMDTDTLKNKIRYWGGLNDFQLQHLIKQCDIHVFPLIEQEGDVEGFGMVALEAAALGIPTIAFACGGAADAVLEGKTGYLIPPDDYEAFGRKIMQLLSKENVLEIDCQSIIDQYSWSNFTKSMLATLGLK